jgi:hypothetical protein
MVDFIMTLKLFNDSFLIYRKASLIRSIVRPAVGHLLCNATELSTFGRNKIKYGSPAEKQITKYLYHDV